MLRKMLAGKIFRIIVSENGMKSYFLFGLFLFGFVNVIMNCQFGTKKCWLGNLLKLLFPQSQKNSDSRLKDHQFPKAIN